MASQSSGWIVASSSTTATTVVVSPVRTMVRTGKRDDSREPAAEAMNMVIEIGSILMPVSSAFRPSTSCR